ncbi:MAG TPA: hypothetical protein VFC56_19730 [Stellaceae bacterium]|nr:hypothetical protein [Stellaceae bacterium]
MRDRHWRRFGAALAGVALYVQLAVAGGGMLALATQGDPGDVLGGHALCLAAPDGAAQPAAPVPSPAAPTHDHGAVCCLWHSLPGIQPLAAAAPLPVAYADIDRGSIGDAPFTGGPRRGPANARAPPTLI